MAETFSRLLDEPRILTEHFGLSADDAKRVVWMRKMELQIGIRRGLVATTFERLAHEQPDGNLDAISLDIERQLGGFALPNDAEPTWASSAFLATYPVYTQSYQLAAMVALQVREALKARFGDDWISPRSGMWLTERLIADGTRYTLSEKLIRTTGATLDNAALLRFLVVP
jgi:hypothetical protein